MSPETLPRVPARTCFPRVSGDEPATMAANPIFLVFSPRERG